MTTPFQTAATSVQAGADAHDEAARLVGRMTVEEKLDCLDGDNPFWPGRTDMMSGGYYLHPWPAAAVDRLGIAGIQFSDGPRGAVIADATAFPVSMARGATFDPALEDRNKPMSRRAYRGASFRCITTSACAWPSVPPSSRNH